MYNKAKGKKIEKYINYRPTKSHAPGVRLTPQRLISRPPAQHPQSHASGKAGEIRKLLVIFALFCPKTQKISGLNVDRAL